MTEQDNASDPKQVKKGKSRDKRNTQQLLNDYRFVLKEAPGRRLIYHILGMCGIYHVSMTGNSYTYFNEGMRQVGVTILNEITEADEGAYIAMQTEELERKRKNS